MFRRWILSRCRALRALQKKRGLQTARDVAYFDFIPAERSTLNDFNARAYLFQTLKIKKCNGGF